MINIKDFNSSLLKKDKQLCKNIGIYNIECITIKQLKIKKILIAQWIISILVKQIGISNKTMERSI